MTTTKEIAQRISGIEYGEDFPIEILDAAEAAGIVIMHGHSDDLVEFYGAFSDEAGAWNGTTVYMTPEGLLQNECDNERCPHFAREKDAATKIKVLWCATSESPSWTIETDIPHETFDIMEDGMVQSRGIVFKLADVAGKDG